MNKIFTAAAVAAIALTTLTGIANASGAKSPAEFQAMLENISAKHAEQRADLML
ncbi:MAG: hypothetical protein HQ504_11595, partial [Rhodospirillaceae bacterium]|nr:hypothetical protein [Rhodospirillaceae bacterium]